MLWSRRDLGYNRAMKLFLRILSNKGQTALEYMLLLVVSAGLALVAFKKLDEYLLSHPDSYLGSSLNNYRKILKTDPRYRQYPLPR
jgi:hypothetical protein